MLRARQRYIDAHGITAAPCRVCGVELQPLQRVNRMSKRLPDGRHVKEIGCSDRCEGCRTKRSLATKRTWTDFDYTRWAEQTLYPGVRYMALTQEERQHCYWLARLRWATEERHLMMPGVTKATAAQATATERQRLKNWQLTLARHGLCVVFPPYTDWLHGDDHTDDFGRAADAPQSGRDDAGADGDAAGAEAA
ncbi:hypothetical protein [Gemmatimonas sp.]|uniref:hypothetical protein n=1 Tax=Gemmatimonas sp. TaxID=1962908 RepID=UPI0025BB40F2|nr:hypothetical protein [Gemmatimonas sp.]MCA2991184.1 hypothetical protein [Gemmatimonas sp.]